MIVKLFTSILEPGTKIHFWNVPKGGKVFEGAKGEGGGLLEVLLMVCTFSFFFVPTNS